MARERGMADKECGVSMREWGWFAYKKRDGTMCHKCRAFIIPGAPSGTWDFPNVGVPAWGRRETVFIDVEVKAGHTSWAFDDLRDNQRKWADSVPERPKWIWICIGKNAVNAVEHPRKTWMFPYEKLLEWENKLERKSLPYDFEELESYELEWLGDDVWGVPEKHPLRTKYGYL